ncbi:hypothetical protein [Dyadobacter sp. NIV53]|uniref:hypothetical protein n=1 Tax=Dyadobacter sp. NIV53 TaxID=2861765 RepID=UPI001C8730E4|nr:hypothetical protein [Dyadobacter sp. NIV53]
MKNSITTFICAMALTTTFAFANTEDKAVSVKNSLPASVPVIESPAPQNVKSAGAYNKYTPAQKASIVELKVVKTSNK